MNEFPASAASQSTVRKFRQGWYKQRSILRQKRFTHPKATSKCIIAMLFSFYVYLYMYCKYIFVYAIKQLMKNEINLKMSKH